MVSKIKDEIIKHIKKHSLISSVLIIFVIVPFGLQIMMWVLSTGVFDVGTDDGWLGFWGGYLGSIIAVIGVYWSVFKQHKFDKESRKPKIIPLEGKIKLQNVSLGNEKITDSSQRYNGIEAFSDIDMPILNGGESIIYDCRCTYKIINIEQLQKNYKQAGHNDYYIEIDSDGRVFYNKIDYSMDGTTAFLNYKYPDWEYTVPYISAKSVKNFKLPIIVPLFIKFLAGNNHVDGNLNEYFPMFEVSLKYRDEDTNEHGMKYKIKFDSVSIKSKQDMNVKFDFSVRPVFTDESKK
ncbi:prophage P1 protein 35 [Lactiplantibacillus plantarum]|uniref:hypothetical protein n=1 Tax=Lactiplantibacillus plantarum TaxID=1590 RepID=UPI00093203B8|nr:hypothetical protein [Lactiplantibacillus plantarum]ARO07125.1 hypothetical protein BIZ33_10160 [Lactiplantibacillus plantarum]MCG0593394.1 prophage P1 protein 35 [Lactiplantibacillus plantarum]MCG0665176.1 prophage P1 protein 35 [Lactiplantibacillus plantarum]MCG0671947.1 prophage P1 protein 35 [Lactiplantibacillus plantarum]MCG0813186.1 prophage P1 protein 35 [Lactiplantibacillus plantarum]